MSAAPKVETVLDYDFLTCAKCGRLVTKLEVLAAVGPGGTGQACPCGALKYSPTNLPWWGWFLPRVLVFAVKRLRGLV
jgi:hypothetical protein